MDNMATRSAFARRTNYYAPMTQESFDMADDNEFFKISDF